MKWLKRIGVALGLVVLMIAVQFLPINHPSNPPVDQPRTINVGITGVAYAVTPDYTTDGTNDEATILTALTAANKGTVILAAGTFNIDAALANNTGASLCGQGSGDLGAGTTLAITGDTYGITFTPSGNYFGKISNVNITTTQNFANTALTINGSTTDIRGRDMVENVTIKAYHAGIGEGTPDITAGSVGLKVTTSSGMCFNKFDQIYVTGFETSMYLYVNRTAGWVYLNGNYFSNTALQYGRILLKIQADTNGGAGTGDIGGNMFTNLSLQPYGVANATDYGIYATGNVITSVKWNVFEPVFAWDWETYAEFEAFYLNAGTACNHITGFWHVGEDSDAGVSNVLTRWGGV